MLQLNQQIAHMLNVVDTPKFITQVHTALTLPVYPQPQIILTP